MNRFIFIGALAALLATSACGSRSQQAYDWDNVSYAYLNCPAGSELAGCKSE
ncbi:MAG: hypothetical protein ACN2B6_02575 [Rickettsiales bacterium]